MTREYGIQLWVTRPDGGREEWSAPGPRVLLGSGAHCDVRFAEADAAREHLVLEVRGEELYAVARHQDPAPTLRGKPFFQSKVERSDEISIGRGRVRAQIVWDVARERVRSKRKRASTLAMLAAILCLPAVAWAALRTDRAVSIGPAPASAPELFQATAKPCRAPSPAQAGVLSRRLRARAVLLREQSPFEATDGIAAVEQFEKAAACFRTANAPQEADEALAAAEVLRRDLAAAYAARRVKLEHALDVGDNETALREARVLTKLLAGKSGAYVEWLRLVQHRLTPAAESAWEPFSHLAP